MTRPTKESHKIDRIISAHSLANTWRELNPSKRDFTQYSHPHNTYARIDHILTPIPLLPFIVSAHIKDTALSDHSIGMISICSNILGRKQGQWKLNESILSSPASIVTINKALKEYLSINDTGYILIKVLWAAHKAYIQGKIIQISTQTKQDWVERLEMEYAAL